MLATCRFGISLAVTLLLVGCGDSQYYAYVILAVTDNASGEPVAGAGVDYVPVSESALGEGDVDAYLDVHGRSAGDTHADGRFQIWVHATVSGMPGDRHVALDDQWVIRIRTTDKTEILVLKSSSTISEQGFFAFLSSEAEGDLFSVRVRTVDTTNGVDRPLPNAERSGYSRVTLEIVDTATGVPIAGAAVEFAAVTHAEIGNLNPDEFLDGVGAFVGTTDRRGHVDVQVFTRVPPLRNCAFSDVGDIWIIRVSVDAGTETIVFDTVNEGLWSIDTAHGPTMTVNTPFGDCLNEPGRAGR